MNYYNFYEYEVFSILGQEPGQLSRLTGVSFGVIQKLRNDH